MVDATQTILTAGVPTLAVVIGILVNNGCLTGTNKRIDDINSRIEALRADLSRQISDTRDILRAELLRVEQVMDARLRHLEENR